MIVIEKGGIEIDQVLTLEINLRTNPSHGLVHVLLQKGI